MIVENNNKISNINWQLVFGIFTFCSSILFSWIFYFFGVLDNPNLSFKISEITMSGYVNNNVLVPSYIIFLFPLIGVIVGLHLIFDSLKIYYISSKLLGISFILLGIMPILLKISFPGIIIPILFIIVGLVVIYQSFFLKLKNK